MSCRTRPVDGVPSGTDREEREEQGHPDRGGHEQEPTAKALDLECPEDGEDHVPCSEDAGDEELRVGVGNPNGVEDFVQVPGYEADS